MCLTGVDYFSDVAPLRPPLPELRRPRSDYDVRHRYGLLALHERSGRGHVAPHAPKNPRAHGRREARPVHVDLQHLIVRRAMADVPAGGQGDPLPAPFQDRRVLEVHLPLSPNAVGPTLAEARVTPWDCSVPPRLCIACGNGRVSAEPGPGLVRSPGIVASWGILSSPLDR